MEPSAPSLAVPEASVERPPVRVSTPGNGTFLEVLRDLVTLAKPRLSSLVLFTTAGGLWLAPGHANGMVVAITLVMTTLAVASANTLNCYLERETDGLMKRTRQRPLPTGRMDARMALVAGLLEAFIAIPVLSWWVNPLCGGLAALAVFSYVAVYTPMKQRSPWAVVVGAIPGAIPPLLGWSAVTGHLELGGIALFAILFVWQLPHFLSISLYLREDYARAGIKVLSVSHGDRITRRWIVATTALMIPVTLSLTPLNLAGWRYFGAASVLGFALLGWTMTGIRGQPGPRWARKLFLGTICYLSLLFIALALDVV